MSRDADIARIAAALDTVPVGDYPWHHEAPHHPEYAAALYDAGLRLLADTPSVEPAGVGVELLIEAIRTATWDAIHDTLHPPTAEGQARDMATRIATKYAKGLERLREKIKALPRSRRSGIGWDAIDRDKVLALLPTQASDSPEKP